MKKKPQKKMLKCQFHTHTSKDPQDRILHTEKDLIKKAKQHHYDVLAITCHDKVVFSKSLEIYARKKGILLLSGIEVKINKKEILIINAEKKAEKIKTFNDLKKYKKSHPDCIIIAPHPYFLGKQCLKDELEKNIDLFDAIEISYCYTTTKNFNKKAIKIAKKYSKPLIATSDCHFLKDLDIGYTNIDAQKNIKSIKQAIKENKIKNQTSPTTYFKIFKTIAMMTWQTFLKKLNF